MKKRWWLVVGLIGVILVGILLVKMPIKKDKVEATETKKAEKVLPTKEQIQNKMLNSIDYFKTASVSFEMYSQKEATKTFVTGKVDLTAHTSNVTTKVEKQSKVTNEMVTEEDPKAYLETYPLDKTYRFVSNKDATTDEDYDSIQSDFKNEYPTVASRYEKYDGQLEVEYRPSPANLDTASNVLFSQEIGLGFLMDQNKWKISGRETLLNRDVIKIVGDFTQDYQSKIGAKTFALWIDEQTGALLKYEGYNDKKDVVDYTYTKSIQFDQTKVKRSLQKEEIKPPKGYKALDIPTK